MSGVYLYKALDTNQATQLVTAWITAARILTPELGKCPIYREFRKLILRLIETGFTREIQSMDGERYYYLEVPSDKRVEILGLWNLARQHLRILHAQAPEIVALEAAISALRETPNDLGKVKGGIND